MFKVAQIVLNHSSYHLNSTISDGLVRILPIDRFFLSGIQTHNSPHGPDYYPHRYVLTRGYNNIILLEDCDFILLDVMGGGKDGNQHFFEFKNKFPNKKLIALDGDDPPQVCDSIMEVVSLYFKSNMVKDIVYDKKVKSCPVAAMPWSVTKRDKNINVYFRGAGHGAVRGEFLSSLSSMYNCSDSRCDRGVWVSEIESSKIGIDLPGEGKQATHRHFEIPYYGTLLFRYKNDNLILENDFIPDKECVEFSSLHEVKVKIDDLLGNTSKLQEITTNGSIAVKNRHLSINRAQKILDELGGL